MLDHPTSSAFCAACGTATCSQSCHHLHLELSNECTFHNNFDDPEQGIIMELVGLFFRFFAEIDPN